MFRIVTTRLIPSALARRLRDKRAGAYASFEGWVRRRNEGEAVRRLEYEAYTDLAEKEGRRILAAARAKFDIIAAACVHRVGRLQPGDLAVWAGVTAEHRAAAFAACRYIIDEVKARVPIWKKEHYCSGETEWINAATKLSRGTGRRVTKKRQIKQSGK